MISVIFDMDGTLLDTQKVYIDAWEYAGREQGIEGAGKYIPSVCGMNREGWSRFLIDRHPTLNVDRFNSDTHDYVSEHGELKFKKGAREFLDYLKSKGVLIGLASGTSRPSIDHHLGELGVKEYFGAIAGGSDVKNCKPAPDVFLLSAKRLGVSPSDCFAFEDSENGIRSAHAAGMRVIGIADIVPFSDEARSLMYTELGDMLEAIDLFEEILSKEI